MIDVTTDGLTLSGTVGWAALLTYLVLLAALGFSIWMLRRGGAGGPELLARVQTRLGLAELHPILFLIAATLWTGLTLMLVVGLYGLIFDVLFHNIVRERQELWDFRFRLAQMVALTGVLGAVVALPFTLVRIGLTRAQNDTAAEALFNDKINAASADLHAQRQVSKGSEDATQFNRWEDDVTRRNAAIDRLEGLVRERPQEASRISRLLSVYVRELSREYYRQKHGYMRVSDLMKSSEDLPPLSEQEALYEADVHPDDFKIDALQAWAGRLRPPRSDMENAVQVLGRLAKIVGVLRDTLEIDLRRTNLQGCHLNGSDFTGARFAFAQMQGVRLRDAKLDKADFAEAELQGAHLNGAHLQGVDLRGAQLQGAYLSRAELKGAGLEGAQLQGAVLLGAKLQGANLNGAQFDVLTSVLGASLRGVALRNVDCNIHGITQHQIEAAYGDASVILGHLKKPKHWDQGEEPLDWDVFEEKWHAHMRTIGMDPENPG